MKPSLVLEANRDAVRALVAKHRAANPRVFGSVARGEDGEGSDLDLLVDPLPESTWRDQWELQDDLEKLLGVKVDLVTEERLRPRIRAHALAEAEPL
jgi:uncharacterized protein